MRLTRIRKIFCVACLGASLTATAQVTVNGGNVDVKTSDGAAVNVAGGNVAVRTPPGGKAAVAVGSGRTAVNVGSGNVVSNTSGTIESTASVTSDGPRKGNRKAGTKGKDADFWGEKGFWGDEGNPGSSRKGKTKGSETD